MVLARLTPNYRSLIGGTLVLVLGTALFVLRDTIELHAQLRDESAPSNFLITPAQIPPTNSAPFVGFLSDGPLIAPSMNRASWLEFCQSGLLLPSPHRRRRSLMGRCCSCKPFFFLTIRSVDETSSKRPIILAPMMPT